MHRSMKTQQQYAQDNANTTMVCTEQFKHNNCIQRTMKKQLLYAQNNENKTIYAQDNENKTTVCTGK